MSDELRPCFKCRTVAPLNSDSLCVTCGEPDNVRVGKWTISYDPPPIPFRGIDYMGVHDDFDGAPDANDRRCLRGSSVEDVTAQIDEYEEYDEAEAYAHASHGCSAPDNEPCVYCEREAERADVAFLDEATRLEAQVKEDEAKWLRTLELTAPVPSVFLEEYRTAQGNDEEAA